MLRVCVYAAISDDLGGECESRLLFERGGDTCVSVHRDDEWGLRATGVTAPLLELPAGVGLGSQRDRLASSVAIGLWRGCQGALAYGFEVE